jgi:outer membrane protein OmpA-like peptidoglycan-associated protein
LATGIVLAGLEGSAEAQQFRLHAKGAVAHAVTEPQASELAWGGGGTLGAEVGIGKYLGLQLQTGALALARGAPPKDPTLAPRNTGVMFGSSAGVRLSAFGFWLDGGGGLAITGGSARPLIDTSLGYDLRVGKSSPLQIGPYVGYEQVIGDPGALRPEDGRIVLFGVHVAFGSKPAPPLPPPRFEAKREPPKKVEEPPQPSDRDLDGIYDAEDACPDVFGVKTDDPSTNGCPETPLRIVEDRLQLPDVIHFEFGSPKVKDRSLELLQQIADYINARGDVVRIDIEGHADEIGSIAYNYYLSRDRAEEVKRLLEQNGIKAELVVHAYGKTKPRAKGHDEGARSQNRRVEFIVTRQRKVKDESVAPQGGGIHASN